LFIQQVPLPHHLAFRVAKRGKRSDNWERIAADSAIVSTDTPTTLAPAAEISN
jgi:hypothetical protein